MIHNPKPQPPLAGILFDQFLRVILHREPDVVVDTDALIMRHSLKPFVLGLGQFEFPRI